MGVGEDFRTFCAALTVTNRSTIATRYQQITRRLNLDFWGYESYTDHSFYTGSYGRGTAIGFLSDVDMIFKLPAKYYSQYHAHAHNGQSALLQSVARAIRKTYSSTDVGGDGQVVVVSFTDGVKFEVVPAFLNQSGSYTFPNANRGGTWEVTNPKPEIEAIQNRDVACNDNLKRLCKMTRVWKGRFDVPMKGLLIDTLAYQFMEHWEYRKYSYSYYDFMCRDFFEFLANQDRTQAYWRAPGSGQYVTRKGVFKYKARQAYEITSAATAFGLEGKEWSARRKWREIYGSAYPG